MFFTGREAVCLSFAFGCLTFACHVQGMLVEQCHALPSELDQALGSRLLDMDNCNVDPGMCCVVSCQYGLMDGVDCQ